LRPGIARFLHLTRKRLTPFFESIISQANARRHGFCGMPALLCMIVLPNGEYRRTIAVMARIDWASKILARALAALGLGALLCFAAMAIADGLLRFFFARPIDAVRDAGALVAAFAVACCLPVAIVERSNITIRFLSSIAGPRAGRIADVAAAILVEIILILMTWQFLVFANQARLTGTATWMLRIPAAPVWAAVALILGISALLQIVVGIKTFHGDYLDGQPTSAD
jgi:TRAP-type C4-dicarboxylate transport system permease small subunit